MADRRYVAYVAVPSYTPNTVYAKLKELAAKNLGDHAPSADEIVADFEVSLVPGTKIRFRIDADAEYKKDSGDRYDLNRWFGLLILALLKNIPGSWPVFIRGGSDR